MLTYMFPGQGSQIRGMGEGLFEKYAELTTQADDILGYSIKELCLSDPSRQLHQTQYTQPALYVVNALAYRQKIEEGARAPDFLIGHSLGEYNALEASGALCFEDGLKLVQKRGELMSQAAPGAMAAVLGLTADGIRDILDRNGLSDIDIANYNNTHQLVLSGLQEDIRRAEPFFEGDDIKYLPVNARGAFHSRYMEPAKVEFEQYLCGFTFSTPDIPVISNVEARPYLAGDIVPTLANQITHSVNWLESIRYLMGQAVVAGQQMVFEEVGVGEVLTKMMTHIEGKVEPLLPEDSAAPAAEPISASEPITAPEPQPQSEPSDSDETSDRTARLHRAEEELHQKIEYWNSTYPVGTKVWVEGYDNALETRTKAMILFGRRAAIYMQGYNGYFALDEVRPV